MKSGTDSIPAPASKETALPAEPHFSSQNGSGFSSRLSILHGDALESLRGLPDESVQCCVTSPPYWGLRDYSLCDCATKRYGSAAFLAWDGAKRNGHSGPCCRREPDSTCPNCRGTGKITGVEGSQLGLEKTPEEYVGKMVEIFREVRRVLRKDGTLWLNLGDSYAGSGKGPSNESSKQATNAGSLTGAPHRNPSQFANGQAPTSWLPVPSGLKPKDLCGIPWRVAFALQADGWYLRSDIIWSKPNPMPESCTDRPTKSHEYLFLLTKSATYFYDAEAIRESPEESNWQSRYERALNGHKSNPDEMRNGLRVRKPAGWATHEGSHGSIHRDGRERAVTYGEIRNGRNKRSVWTIATAPYPEAHFATYPPDLIKPCILAGTSAKGCCSKCGAPWERVVERGEPDLEHRRMCGGDDRGEYRGTATKDFAASKAQDASATKARILAGMTIDKTTGWQPICGCGQYLYGYGPVPCTVLDPFAGSGTTGEVALELGRRAILIELNPAYGKLIEQRCNITLGLELLA